MSEKSTYVVIHGMNTSSKTAVDYVANIVYGNPKVDAVAVGNHFVAICEYGASQFPTAQSTFERMGSFPHGAQLMIDLRVALCEFGTWVRHYAPGTIVGLEVEAV